MKQIRIALDISQSLYSGTGVARFTNGLINQIISKRSESISWVFFYNSFRLDFDPERKKAFSDAGIRVVRIPLPPTIATPFWNRFRLVTLESVIGTVDWIITSDWYEPPATHARKVTIVHDLVFKRYPETVAPVILHTMERKLSLVARESKGIICDSNATRDDLGRYYGIVPERTTTIYPGVTVPTVTDSDVTQVRKVLGIKGNYILTVGKSEPRKNLNRLMKQFDRLDWDGTLIIVGPKGWENLDTPSQRIKLAGYVSDTQLHALYKGCTGFIFPSLWEGFGYPLLEAMQHERPVACSNRSSLRELSSGYAYEFDPEHDDGISTALSHLTHIKPDPARLAAAKTHALSFSWSRYLQELVQYITQL